MGSLMLKGTKTKSEVDESKKSPTALNN